MGVRVTTHNGRSGKNGVFNVNHNDRQFTSEDDHINKEKSKNNVYWKCRKGNMTFEDCERQFYASTFTEGLERINAKHRKKGNYDRVKTMDDYRESPRTCPEETLYYIGNRKDKIDRKTLTEIVYKQAQWEYDTFPNVRLLDMACHFDEEVQGPVKIDGAGHVHMRKVYIGHDEYGNKIVNQNKALEEMGIERPDPDQPVSRFNNAKITYTKMVREHFIELCKSYGIEVITEPRDKSKAGLSLNAYKASQMLSDARETQEQANTLLKSVKAREKAVIERENDITEHESDLSKRERALEIEKSRFGEAVQRAASKQVEREQETQAERPQPRRGIPFGGQFDL